jgi:outer membrane protein assembly factor BamB
MNMKPRLLTLALATVSAFAATAASAQVPIGLSGQSDIVTFDGKGKAATTVKLDRPVQGIDVRPADGKLYGVTTDGAVVTIDPKTGKTTEKSKLSETLKAGSTATIDFNPVADRLRVMSDDGTSHRVNVDDGKVTVDKPHNFKEGDANAGKTPKVMAGAYTNSKNGPKPEKTALFNIDASGALVKQDPPNDGVLNTIGSIGMTPTGPVAFNIVSDGTKNEAWLAHGGTLYSINLETGAAKEAMKLEGGEKLTDLAWWE